MLSQNKSVQWALAAAVILVWGLVWYRFRQLNPSEDTGANRFVYTPLKSGLPADAPDSLFIRADYPDPFFPGRRTVDPAAGTSRAKTSVRSTAPVFSAATIPVQYHGFSEDQTKRRRARLTVSGKSVTLEPGRQYGELRIKTVSADSIQVVWQGAAVVIFRKKG